MIAPHYISENKSDMRSIKHGWYAADDDGKLSSGPFSSREECIRRIRRIMGRRTGNPDGQAAVRPELDTLF